MYSGGRAYFHWGVTSTASCNIRWFLLQWSDGLCSWLMTTLSAERVFALYFPLRHRALYSLKVTYALLGTVLLYSFLVALPGGLSAAVVAVGAAGQVDCHADLTDATWPKVVLVVLVSGFNIYVYPVLLSMLFSCLVVLKLLALGSSSRRELGVRPAEQQQRPSRRERSACATILVILAIEFLLYVPICLIFTVAIVIQLFHPEAMFLAGVFLNISFTWFNLSLFKRFTNLFVYVARVPSIRYRLCCKSLTASKLATSSTN